MSVAEIEWTEDMDRAANLALRSCLSRLLASALSYPTEEKFESLRQCLRVCEELSEDIPRRIAAKIELFAASIEQGRREAYEDEYLRVFSHVCAADCNPCETAYTSKHIFQASQKMANITGFYQAFGLQADRERPDHIAVEMEFLSFLCYRESIERSKSSVVELRSLRRAQRVFLERHLGKWVGTFCQLMKRKAAKGPMFHLACLLDEVVKSEAARHRVALPKVQIDLQNFVLDCADSAPSPLTLADGDFSGGVFDA